MYLSYNLPLVLSPLNNLPPPLSPFPEMRSYPYLASPLLAAATTGLTGGDRMGRGMCPGTTRYATEALLVYSSFTPYWAFNVSQRNAEACCVVANCLFEAAGESRKQQFGATALVMGLIPPTIKDLAWPERRIVYVTKNLHWVVEMLVLALGLVPQVTGDQKETRRLGCEGALVADWAWRNNTMRTRVLMISVFVGTLEICYGSLVAMEVLVRGVRWGVWCLRSSWRGTLWRSFRRGYIGCLVGMDGGGRREIVKAYYEAKETVTWDSAKRKSHQLYRVRVNTGLCKWCGAFITLRARSSLRASWESRSLT
jgi:hypothetical protein